MGEKKVPLNRKRLEQIASEYGTPFYIYDETAIKENAQRLHSAFSWAHDFKNYFAVKACPNHFIVKILASHGMGADCSSIAELELATRVGLLGNNLILSSNSTHERTFLSALDKAAIINLDDPAYIDDIIRLGKDRLQSICFRYNPGDKISGNSIIGNGTDAKFGSSIESLIPAYKRIKEMFGRNIRYGIHVMAASNQKDTEYFKDLAGQLFDTIAEITSKTGIQFSFANLGGGIGIAYQPNETEPNLIAISQAIKHQYEQKILGRNIPEMQIIMENGRMVTGPFGYFVTKVLHIENKHRDYVRVDASEAQFPRPGIYDAYHHIIVSGKEDAPLEKEYDVAGGLCENWKFAEQRKLPKVDAGDILVVCDAGAHCFAMSSNYNGWERPPELLLCENKKILLIRKRQDIYSLYEDIPLSSLARFEMRMKK